MVLRSVGVLSAGKIMGVLGVIGGLLVGLMFALISLAGVAAPQAPGGGDHALPAAFLGVGAIIFFPIVYGIFGFIGGLIYALLYNLAAGLIGGLELEFESRTQ